MTGSITNDGDVSGGAGGGKTLGGGIGIEMAAPASLDNTGMVTGGTGGFAGTNVGTGGIAVDRLAGGIVVNSGDITGGAGGSSPVATGGNGGTDISFAGSSTAQAATGALWHANDAGALSFQSILMPHFG